MALPPRLWHLETTGSGRTVSRLSVPHFHEDMGGKKNTMGLSFGIPSLPGRPAHRRKTRGHRPGLWVGEG